MLTQPRYCLLMLVVAAVGGAAPNYQAFRPSPSSDDCGNGFLQCLRRLYITFDREQWWPTEDTAFAHTERLHFLAAAFDAGQFACWLGTQIVNEHT